MVYNKFYFISTDVPVKREQNTAVKQIYHNHANHKQNKRWRIEERSALGCNIMKPITIIQINNTS